MSFLDKLEQKVVFPLVRIIALISIGILLITTLFTLGDFLINESHAARPIVEKAAQKKQELADNITAIITEIERQTEDSKAVVAGIQQYFGNTIDQIRDGIVGGTLSRINWAISILMILAPLALIGIFCLTLSLLSIERNTREKSVS